MIGFGLNYNDLVVILRLSQIEKKLCMLVCFSRASKTNSLMFLFVYFSVFRFSARVFICFVSLWLAFSNTHYTYDFFYMLLLIET